MLKKIFIIFASLFVVTAVLYGLYAVLFQAPSSVSDVTEKPAQDASPIAPKPAASAIETLLEGDILSPKMLAGDKIVYLEKTTGTVYSIDTHTREKKILLETNAQAIITAIWSKGGDRFFLKTTTADGPLYRLYDTTSAQVVDLKKGIRYLNWDELSEKIVYSYKDPANGKLSLNIADPNGSNWRELTSLTAEQLYFQTLPGSTRLSFWSPPRGVATSDLKTVNLVGAPSIKTIFAGKFGADYRWSPQGDKILASFSDTKGGSRLRLAVMNAEGGEYRDLNFVSMASKCVWSHDNITLYCAMPSNIPENALMPDEYLDKKVFTQDTFWKINTTNGKTERVVDLAEITQSYDATDLMLSSDETSLFFINRRDGKALEIHL